MIIYRPNSCCLRNPMEDVKEFENFDEMKQFIYEGTESCDGVKPFEIDDIVIDDITQDDPDLGWKDMRRICIKRFFGRTGNFICIGFCTTNYEGMKQMKDSQKEQWIKATPETLPKLSDSVWMPLPEPPKVEE